MKNSNIFRFPIAQTFNQGADGGLSGGSANAGSQTFNGEMKFVIKFQFFLRFLIYS